jgi:hypothetical protein
VKARAFPVSVKGVTVQAGKVLLLENERDEWELPGGKLELGEDPADCVVREIGEVPGLEMPAGYKRSITAWFARLDGPTTGGKTEPARDLLGGGLRRGRLGTRSVMVFLVRATR